MRLLGGKDLYRLSFGRSLSDADLSRAANCYLPLIGATGMGVYAYLHSQVQLYNGNRFFDSAFNETSLNPDQFSAGLGLLEGVGLIRVFAAEREAFLLCVYPPLSYEGFFAHPLLSRKLKEAVGEQAYSYLSSKLLAGAIDANGLVEVTTPFSSAFKDIDEAPIRLSFDKSEFASGLSQAGRKINLLSDQEIEMAARLSEFYSVSSMVTGQLAGECLDYSSPFGAKLDLRKLERKLDEASAYSFLAKKEEKSPVGNDSRQAEAIRLFDSLTPLRYLSFYQGGGKPSPADGKLVRQLKAMGLTDPVINALLSFTLSSHGNTLPPYYVTMMAGILARNRINTSRDAIEFLVDYDKKQKGKARKDKAKPAPKAKKEPVLEDEEEKVSLEEGEAALREIFGD